MIEGIKRMVRNPSGGGDTWDADRELEPEVEEDFELPVENTVLVSPLRMTHDFTSKCAAGVEYQRSLVRTAIEQGGEFHGNVISLPWLRMILAGLEGRPVEPDEVWREDETPDPLNPPKGPEPPAFYHLFPAEKDSPDSAPF